MRKQTQLGFTIVELLIVIVVIGILAAMTIVSYNGVQAKALNNSRVAEASQWQDVLMQYAATNGQYPVAITSTSVCLGESFADVNSDGVGDCWDLHAGGNIASESAALATEVKKTVPKLPNATRKPVSGAGVTLRIGPAAQRIASGEIKIIYWISGTAACPMGAARWNDAVSRACELTLPAAS